MRFGSAVAVLRGGLLPCTTPPPSAPQPAPLNCLSLSRLELALDTCRRTPCPSPAGMALSVLPSDAGGLVAGVSALAKGE